MSSSGSNRLTVAATTLVQAEIDHAVGWNMAGPFGKHAGSHCMLRLHRHRATSQKTIRTSRSENCRPAADRSFKSDVLSDVSAQTVAFKTALAYSIFKPDRTSRRTKYSEFSSLIRFVKNW
jgi:hypothetical protein